MSREVVSEPALFGALLLGAEVDVEKFDEETRAIARVVQLLVKLEVDVDEVLVAIAVSEGRDPVAFRRKLEELRREGSRIVERCVVAACRRSTTGALCSICARNLFRASTRATAEHFA